MEKLKHFIGVTGIYIAMMFIIPWTLIALIWLVIKSIIFALSLPTM